MRGWTLPLVGAVAGTAVAWLALPGLGALAHRAIPAERWLEVRSVRVDDAAPGASPLVRVDRKVRRAFNGHWTVTLRREMGDGFATVCTRHGRSDYRAGAVLPEETDLDWWMETPPNPRCPATLAGRYMVTIAWTLEIAGLTPKVVRADSNVFEVTP